MNKYIKKIGGSYLKRGYYKRKFKVAAPTMQDLIDIYVPADWKIKCTTITYKNN